MKFAPLLLVVSAAFGNSVFAQEASTVWNTKCIVSQYASPYQIKISFTPTGMVLSSTEFVGGKDCQTPNNRNEATTAFKPDFSHTETAMFEMRISTLTDLTYTLLNPTKLEAYNRTNECGFNQWKLNAPHSVLGQEDCGLSKDDVSILTFTLKKDSKEMFLTSCDPARVTPCESYTLTPDIN